MKKTLYQILGVDPKALAEDVTAAYNQRIEELSLATLHDPNKLVVLQQAKEILSDTNKRAAYDASLATPVAARRVEVEEEPEPGFLEEWGKWIAVGVVLIGIGAWWANRSPPPPPQKLPPPEVASPATEAAPEPVQPATEPAATGEAKENVSPPAAVPPQEETPASPIVGVWSCHDAISGRTSNYDFQPDGTLTITATDGPPVSLKYEVSGQVLKLANPTQSSALSIEVSTANKMVLNTGVEGRRLVCNR